MFTPKEVIFAPTGRCNLHCSHCRVERSKGELDIGLAKTFLESCAKAGIERLGFSGGEPFLRPDFLAEIIKSAVAQDMYFDRLMTNGVFWRTEKELDSALEAIYESGFDGTLGLSHDIYHGQEAGKLARFLSMVYKKSGRKDNVEILSVRSENEKNLISDFEFIAEKLGGRLELSGSEPVRIVDNNFIANRAAMLDGASLYINILRFPYSAHASENAWNAAHWFQDDYCEGPGQLLYVHPDGSVAVCCGFANERPELVIGSIKEDAGKLIEKARIKASVKARYEFGLGNTRKALEAQGVVFPGKSGDQCFFCDYLCHKGLA